MTKIIPFDLDTVKKIQAGEIKGKIKYSEGDGYAYDAEIIKFDLIANKAKAKPNSNLYRTIVAVIDFDNHQDVRVFNTDGYGYNQAGDVTNLFLEVPDNEPKEPQFKPFDKVLVRDDEFGWIPTLYSYKTKKGTYMTINGEWDECIPYEGNQELVGTTDKPKEE